jgi:DNA-binding CsgD family transcriptional regulator
MRSIWNDSANYGDGLLGSTRCLFAPDWFPAAIATVSVCHEGTAPCPHCWLCVGLRSYDLLGVGLVICDQECHVLGANRCASTLLQVENDLYVTADGELRLSQRTGQMTSSSLSQAVQRVLVDGKDVALLVRRSSDKPALTVLVKSVGRSAPVAPSNCPLVLVLVLIIDPSLPQDARLPDLQRLYSFAPDEARLASLLAEGFSLEQCCDELAISSSRASQQLETMLRKLGLRQESELVALLNRGSDDDSV